MWIQIQCKQSPNLLNISEHKCVTIHKICQDFSIPNSLLEVAIVDTFSATSAYYVGKEPHVVVSSTSQTLLAGFLFLFDDTIKEKLF